MSKTRQQNRGKWNNVNGAETVKRGSRYSTSHCQSPRKNHSTQHHQNGTPCIVLMHHAVMQEQSEAQYSEYTDLCCERVHGPRMDGSIIHD